MGGTQPVYVYGVVRAAMRKPTGTGVAGADVGAVVFDGIAALTSEVPESHVRARRRDLIAHADVLSNALEDGPVLPLQFGNVFPDHEAVISDFLEPRKRDFEKLLREFDGRVELSVRAFYVGDAILAEIVRDNARIARLREAVRDLPEAATYGARIELGELVAGELQARARRDGAAILEQLEPIARAVDVDPEPIEHQVLRASFLVDRARLSRFDDAVNRLARGEEGRMRFKYIGPLAPHSFVSLGSGGPS